MGRAAGNKSYYTFVLRDEVSGRYRQDVTIELPSSTHIIKSTLAAQQLVGWSYRSTRDVVAGLVSVLKDTMHAEDIIDMLEDGDWLEEVLKHNKLRPDDIRDERATEGKREHKLLEDLGDLALKDPELAYDRARYFVDKAKGSERAILQWWLDKTPYVVGSEMVLPCPQHGYCGTTDLVWVDSANEKVGTDLKTRRAGLYDYDSDQFQVDSYRLAYNLLNPQAPITRGSVLLAFDDGEYDEAEVILPEGEFLKIKQVYDSIEQARLVDKKFGR